MVDFSRTEGMRARDYREEEEVIQKGKTGMHDGIRWCRKVMTEESSDLERERQRRSRHAIAKAALYIVSSPEGCDIFLQSLLAVLISLHMSWMKIEFVWKRGRYYWLFHCLLIVCVCALAYKCLCVLLRVSVHAHVCKHCPHQSQPIHNSNGLCFSHTSLSVRLTSAVPAYLMAKT